MSAIDFFLRRILKFIFHQRDPLNQGTDEKNLPRVMLKKGTQSVAKKTHILTL